MARRSAPAAVVVALCLLAAACTSGTSTSADSPATDAGDAGVATAATEIASQRTLQVDDEGLAGRLYVPEDAASARKLLVLGGSDGGTPDAIAKQFARAGYVTLALAYFDEPDLPQGLHSIRLEYFARGLRWLRDRPAGTADAPALWGASRGGEAALLVAATYPDLVSGVVAGVPSHVVWCGYPRTSRPSWTLDGKPLRCLRHGFPFGYFGDSPSEVPRVEAAEIPVEDIEDPALLICGGKDTVWKSCPMSDAAMGRIETASDPPAHRLRAYPEAGHYVSVPPQVQLPSTAGGSPEANEKARASAWEATLRFLENLPD